VAAPNSVGAAVPRFTRSAVLANRSSAIVVAVIGVLAVNLAIYVVSRACGATFTYTANGKATNVSAGAVALLTVGPLTTGIALIASLSRKWPVMTVIARVVFPTLAVATIWLMTLPARFDTASTWSLATMHVALIPAAMFALGALDPVR